jgi:hypothetical protein
MVNKDLNSQIQHESDKMFQINYKFDVLRGLAWTFTFMQIVVACRMIRDYFSRCHLEKSL